MHLSRYYEYITSYNSLIKMKLFGFANSIVAKTIDKCRLLILIY